MNNGDVAILNCTDGDTRISFDSADEGEVERARAVVEDMLRRGYCISVVVEGKMERAIGFDAAKGEYIVSAPAPAEPHEHGAGERPKREKRRVPAKGTKAYAVGQTAGGGFGFYAHGIRREQLAERRP